MFRDLALFDLAIDSKLRGCDVVALRVGDVVSAGAVRRRAIVLQQKTGRPVQFEITDQTRQSIARWLERRPGYGGDWLFPSRQWPGEHVSTREYSRLVWPEWPEGVPKYAIASLVAGLGRNRSWQRVFSWAGGVAVPRS